jgi:DNA invertase Pin-like site-specific DNA recombinase
MSKVFALYLRVSSDSQSTDMQKHDLVKWAEARGFQYKIYEDKGTGTNANRKMLQQLILDAKARRISGVALWKMDRLFRSMKHAVVTLSEWTEQGVDFYSHKDQIDMTTSTGRLLGHLLMAFAEWEADTIRTRVRSGLLAAKARGVKLGRPKIISPEIIQEVLNLRFEKNLSIRQVSEQISLSLKQPISKTSCERIIREYGPSKVTSKK